MREARDVDEASIDSVVDGAAYHRLTMRRMLMRMLMRWRRVSRWRGVTSAKLTSVSLQMLARWLRVASAGAVKPTVAPHQAQAQVEINAQVEMT